MDADGTGSTVRLEIADAIATITLDRPDALNALTIPMKGELLDAIERAGADDAVRVIVLTGAGRAFCAGQDLRERLEPDAPALGDELRDRYNPIVRALRHTWKPVIASVNGVAAGAGFSLALACDLRIAADTATFVLAFGRIGLVPDSGATWLLPRLIGAARAAEIAYLDEPLTAEAAVAIGLATRVVPAGDLAAETRRIALALAEKAPYALAATKEALEAALTSGFSSALDLEAALQDTAGRTEDHAEGIAAFMEKRAPRFRGV